MKEETPLTKSKKKFYEDDHEYRRDINYLKVVQELYGKKDNDQEKLQEKKIKAKKKDEKGLSFIEKEPDLGKLISQDLKVEEEVIANNTIIRTDTFKLLRNQCVAERNYLEAESKKILEEIKSLQEKNPHLKSKEDELHKSFSKKEEMNSLSKNRRNGVDLGRGFEIEKLEKFNSLNEKFTDEVEPLKRRLKVVFKRQETLANYLLILDIWQKNMQWCPTTFWRVLYIYAKSLEQAKSLVIPALMNLRGETISSLKKEFAPFSFNRSGVTTDFRNPVSLTELQFLLRNKKGIGKDVDKDILFEKALVKWDKKFKSGKLEKRITDAYPILDNQLLEEEAKNQLLEDIIEERRRFLLDLVLQDLFVHFEKKGVSEDLVTFIRFSLLDAIKKGDKDNGLVIHELIQLLDEVAVYKDLESKQIVFDLQGDDYYIDLDGLIHMPEKFDKRGKSKDAKVQIRSIVLNISSQGNKQNQGPQAIINQDALEQLKIIVQDKDEHLAEDVRENLFLWYVKLENDLKVLSGKPKHVHKAIKTATRLLEALVRLEKIDIRLSTNCYGGKDRTGALSAVIVNNIIEDILVKRKMPEEFISGAKIEVNRQYMISLEQIVEDNMPGSGAKVETSNPVVKDQELNRQMQMMLDMFAGGIKTLVGKVIPDVSPYNTNDSLRRTFSKSPKKKE